MALKSTLSAKNLEALGAERLAQLLIEICTGDAAAKRKLRLALAGAEGPKEAAREIAKRLTSIARAWTFVNWQNRKPLVKDLETQRSAIMEQSAPHDPREALALLWRFVTCAYRWAGEARLDPQNPIVIDLPGRMIALLPEHQPLPVWKHSGSKRERFVAAYCEIQRRDDPGQGLASHGKCEG